MNTSEFDDDNADEEVSCEDDNSSDGPGLVDVARVSGKIALLVAVFFGLCTTFVIALASDSRVLSMVCGPALWALALGGDTPIGFLSFVALTFLLFGMYVYLIATKNGKGLLMLLVIHGFSSIAFYVGLPT